MKINNFIGLLAVASTASALYSPFGIDISKRSLGDSASLRRDATSWVSFLRRDPANPGGEKGSGGNNGGKAPTGGSPASFGGSSGGGVPASARNAGGSGAAAVKPAPVAQEASNARPAGGASGGNAAAGAVKAVGGPAAAPAASKPQTGGGAEGAAAKPANSPIIAPKVPAPSNAAAAAPVASHAPVQAFPQSHADAAPAVSHPAAGQNQGGSAPQAAQAHSAPLAASSPNRSGGGNANRGGSVGDAGGGANAHAASPAAPANSPKHASSAAPMRQPANFPNAAAGQNKADSGAQGFPSGGGGGQFRGPSQAPNGGNFPHQTQAPQAPPQAPQVPHSAPIPIPTPIQPKPTQAGSACPAVWTQISADLKILFTQGAPGPGQCNDMARAVVRMAFHDCGAWDLSMGFSAGCDGSLYHANEYTLPANAGMEQSVPQYCSLASKYGVSVADFIQFGAAHATVTCPLGPTVQTFVGRQDRWTQNAVHLLPNATDSGDALVANFAAKGLSAAELAALIGAHSTAKQFEFDPSRSGALLDDTPGIWDVRYYSEVLEGNAPFILPSDTQIANNGATAGTFKSFVKNQNLWNAAFSKSMTHLSMLGVPPGGLIDCTSALPPPQDNFQEPAGLMNIKKRRFGGFHGGFHGFGGGHGHGQKKYHA